MKKELETGINKQELKKLTWKYFGQQKIKEVGIFFGVVAGLGVAGLFSYFLGKWIVRNEDNFLNFMVGIFITMVIAFVGWVLFGWLTDNWERAKNRATIKLIREQK